MSIYLEYTKVRERLTLAEDITNHLAEKTAGMLTSGEIPEQEEGGLENLSALYNNMEGVYEGQGEYDKALEYYAKALAIRERKLGTEHPYTTTTYNNMAGVFFVKSDYTNALTYFGKLWQYLR